jgi:hypothetical protein
MNGTTRGANGTPRAESRPGVARARTNANCPTCGSAISRQRYEQILRIDEARQKQLAAERGAIEREREALKKERTNVAQAAAAAERARWETTTAKVKAAAARDVERLRTAAEAERQRLTRVHEKRMEAEVRKREAKDKQLAGKQAALQARARAEADSRVRDARRTAEERQSGVVESLRERLGTEQQRRQREEAGWKERIAQLQQKAEVRDAGHFGPESQDALVKALRDQFRGDEIEELNKNGDVLQTVLDVGKNAGNLVYECKKRSDWQRKYLRQIQLAMEAHNTRYGILVTRIFPKRRSGLCILGGVILVAPEIAVDVAAIVRAGIIAISRLSSSEEGKERKVAALFAYIRSDDFVNAMQLVQAKLAELREHLARERSNHEGWWRMREQHYATIARATSGIQSRIVDMLGAEAGKGGGSSAHLNGKKV